MNFKKIICLVIAGIGFFTLTGCELVNVNTQKDDNQIVLIVKDKQYKKVYINNMVDSQLSMYGITDTKTKDYDDFRIELLESYAKERAVTEYAIEAGYLDSLSQEDRDSVDEEYEKAKKEYEEDIADYVYTEYNHYEDGDDHDHDGDGVNDHDESEHTAHNEAEHARLEKVIEEEQQKYLYAFGIENIEELKQVLLEEKAMDNYLQEYKNKVSISDDDVLKEFNKVLEEQKSSYDSNPSNYMTDVNNATDIYYTPQGFRYVKHILIQFDDETTTKITELETSISNETDEEKKKELENQLTELEKSAKEKAGEVYQKIVNGGDFTALQEEFNEDTGAQVNQDGYLMHKDVTDQYVSSFQDAGMALEKIGDISEPVRSEYGYHIMMYASDVQSGAKEFDSIKEDLSAQMLEEKQQKEVETRKTEIYDKYKEDGTIKIYKDKVKIAIVPGK